MDYLELYKKRITSDGDNVGDALRENTHYFKNKKFKDGMTYRLANVYRNMGTPSEIVKKVDVRVIEIDRQGGLRNILFRPNEYYEVGNIVEFDDTQWLAYDTYGSVVDDIKLRVSRINDIMKWRDETGIIREIPCITATSYLGSGAKSNDTGLTYNNFNVQLPIGKIYMFVELNELTKNVKIGQRFICGSKPYKVTHIDDISLVDSNYYGILQISLDIDLRYRDRDDFENGIAYNDIWEIDSKGNDGDGDGQGGNNGETEEWGGW